MKGQDIKVVFCGVGEAFDQDYPNTSILAIFLDKRIPVRILLDCGFTAAPSFWKMYSDPLELDGVWISHLHGDHFFGLPQLLIRLSEHGRQKDLHICGVQGIKEAVTWAMELAYPGKMTRLSFGIVFSEADFRQPFEICGIRARAVEIDHPQACLGVRFDFRGKSLFYTGDGRVPESSRKVVHDCDLGIFETFSLDSSKHGHSNVEEAGAFAAAAGIRHVAAVHMQRAERKSNGQLVQARLQKKGVRGVLPEPGHVIVI